SSRRRHTRFSRDWSSDVCSSDHRSKSTYFNPKAVASALSSALGRTVDEKALTGERITLRGIDTVAFEYEGYTWSWNRSTNRLARSEERRVGKEWRAR